MAHRGRKSADEALIAALAGGATVDDAAVSARISPRTVHRRLADPVFCRRVTDARGAMLESALAHLADASIDAAKTLRRLLGSTDGTALSAAKAILEIGPRLRETVELQERLGELERIVELNSRKPIPSINGNGGIR